MSRLQFNIKNYLIMSSEIQQYKCYRSYSDPELIKKRDVFEKLTLFFLDKKVHNAATPAFSSLTMALLDPKKSETWLNTWRTILIEESIASSFEQTAASMHKLHRTLDDLHETARMRLEQLFFETAQKQADERIKAFKEGCMLVETEKLVTPSSGNYDSRYTIKIEDLRSGARGGLAEPSKNQLAILRERYRLETLLQQKKEQKKVQKEIDSLHAQFQLMAWISSQGKELSDLTEQEITDEWNAFEEQRLRKKESEVASEAPEIDPEFLKELAADESERKTPVATASVRKAAGKRKPKPRPKPKEVLAVPEKKGENKAVSESVTVGHVLGLKQHQFSLHRRILRWRGAKLDDIPSFTDFDSQLGTWVHHYASYTPKELQYQKWVHEIPMEQILCDPALLKKYSFGYRFCGPDGTKNLTGRCFYAEMTDGNKKVEKGLIRVAVNEHQQIYHIHFQKTGVLAVAHLMQSIPCPKADSFDEKEPPDGAEWQHTSPYGFSREPNGTILITVHEDGTTFRVYPLT
jgi:hypothetical protein